MICIPAHTIMYIKIWLSVLWQFAFVSFDLIIICG